MARNGFSRTPVWPENRKRALTKTPWLHLSLLVLAIPDVSQAGGPKHEPLPDADKARITFTGFEATGDQSCRVRVRLSRSVTVELGSTPKSFSYLLKQAYVPIENNRRPLLTQYFGCEVSSVRLENSGDDALLTVELSAPVTARHEFNSRAHGEVNLDVELRISKDPTNARKP